jgi:hypothetical protein
VKLDEMTPALRRAAVAALARDLDERARPRTSAREAATREGAGRMPEAPRSSRADRYRCGTCGAMFTAWAPAERHADTHGGARLEMVL